MGAAAWYAGGQAVKGAWKARSVFKKRGFRAGMRATWRNVKKSWSWKSFGKEVAIGAATGGLGALAKSGRLASYGAKAARGARVGRCRVLTKGSRFANRVSRGRIPAKAYCFVAGTLVLTRGRYHPHPGYRSRRPRDVSRRGHRTATPSHPFWVEGTGWVDGGELTAGMALSLTDGGRATILSVTREKLASPQDVYNFEVADFHTYFVASAGVWVHNMCAAKLHGNSLNSKKTTYLYRLYEKGTRKYLKTGITSRPGRRYTKKFMVDKDIEYIAKGTRRQMIKRERHIVERNPGPLNRERWAGRYRR